MRGYNLRLILMGNCSSIKCICPCFLLIHVAVYAGFWYVASRAWKSTEGGEEGRNGTNFENVKRSSAVAVVLDHFIRKLAPFRVSTLRWEISCQNNFFIICVMSIWFLSLNMHEWILNCNELKFYLSQVSLGQNLATLMSIWICLSQQKPAPTTTKPKPKNHFVIISQSVVCDAHGRRRHVRDTHAVTDIRGSGTPYSFLSGARHDQRCNALW